jgi:hypothetical protein
MGKFEDRLWRELVRKHGADLAQMTRPAAKPARRARPRLLAGTSIGLAVAGTAAVLVLSAASSPPAFAVSRNSDGTYTVRLQKLAGIGEANAKLAQLGIHARLVEVTSSCTVKTLPPTAAEAMQLARTVAATPQVAIAKLDPRKIPPGKWQVIPTYRVAGAVHVESGHLMAGAAPACISTVVAPPCKAHSPQALRDLRPGTGSPAEAAKRAAQALASSTTGNSGNSGNSGTSTSTPTHAQVPVPAWVVGCYLHVPAGHPSNTGNSGNSGNSGTSGNS